MATLLSGAGSSGVSFRKGVTVSHALASQDQIDLLLADRKYELAASLLEEVCRQQPRNVRARRQLADILTLAGEGRKAFKVLEELVNDYARVGHFATAMALVKKMQLLEPGRRDLDFKLAVLVKKHQKKALEPAATAPKTAATAPPAGDAEGSDVVLRNVVREREVLRLSDSGSGLSTIQASALFQGFDAKQLGALIGGLQLTSVQPGEIIVAEGQPGGSLYLIATGSVRVYVRNTVGRQNQIRVLRQGDFFGEISLLRASRRTATITAATACELLELDRQAVNTIAERHPKVWTIIEDFCVRRAGSVEELGARTRT